MSLDAMENALRLYEDSRPMHSVLPQARDGFREGWAAAMRFMAQPRSPSSGITVAAPLPKPCLHPTDPLQRQYYVPTPVHKEPDPVAERFTGWKAPKIHWSEEELAILQQAAEAGNPPKEHNPHGLVAFYTDAPVCAMCGGRGVIGSVSREDPGGNQEPCPECNPEGLPRGCNV